MDSHIKNLNLNLEMIKWVQQERNSATDQWLQEGDFTRKKEQELAQFHSLKLKSTQLKGRIKWIVPSTIGGTIALTFVSPYLTPIGLAFGLGVTSYHLIKSKEYQKKYNATDFTRIHLEREVLDDKEKLKQMEQYRNQLDEERKRLNREQLEQLQKTEEEKTGIRHRLDSYVLIKPKDDVQYPLTAEEQKELDDYKAKVLQLKQQ